MQQAMLPTFMPMVASGAPTVRINPGPAGALLTSPAGGFSCGNCQRGGLGDTPTTPTWQKVAIALGVLAAVGGIIAVVCR